MIASSLDLARKWWQWLTVCQGSFPLMSEWASVYKFTSHYLQMKDWMVHTRLTNRQRGSRKFSWNSWCSSRELQTFGDDFWLLLLQPPQETAWLHGRVLSLSLYRDSPLPTHLSLSLIWRSWNVRGIEKESEIESSQMFVMPFLFSLHSIQTLCLLGTTFKVRETRREKLEERSFRAAISCQTTVGRTHTWDPLHYTSPY